MMRAAILANPVSGSGDIETKRALLQPAAAILRAEIFGLDTRSETEFVKCGSELAKDADLIAVAGGDGAFSQIMNSIDPRRTALAYFPMGSGNALRHAFNLNGLSFDAIAKRIIELPERALDLIDCDGRRRAFMASVGIEATALALREKHTVSGRSRFSAYARAGWDAYFNEYRRRPADISIDGETRCAPQLLSAMIVKQPFYGFGMNVAPRARFDDGKLHTVIIESGLLGLSLMIAESFTIGNRVGRYRAAETLTIRCGSPLRLQYDGELGWEAEAFEFRVLPGLLRVAGLRK